jgi:hypothetical protein
MIMRKKNLLISLTEATFLKHLKCLLLVSAFVCCCKSKEDDKPTNQQPQNTWSIVQCKVDGADWGDCQKILMSNSSNTSAGWLRDFTNTPLWIEAINTCGTNDTISFIYIRINDFQGTGEYILNEYSFASYRIGRGFKDIRYRTDSNNTGIINISQFNEQTQRVTGTFNFVGFNTDSNKVVTITEGKFNNIKWMLNQ